MCLFILCISNSNSTRYTIVSCFLKAIEPTVGPELQSEMTIMQSKCQTKFECFQILYIHAYKCTLTQGIRSWIICLKIAFQLGNYIIIKLQIKLALQMKKTLNHFCDHTHCLHGSTIKQLRYTQYCLMQYSLSIYLYCANHFYIATCILLSIICTSGEENGCHLVV